jgi:hypothetical protein
MVEEEHRELWKRDSRIVEKRSDEDDLRSFEKMFFRNRRSMFSQTKMDPPIYQSRLNDDTRL